MACKNLARANGLSSERCDAPFGGYHVVVSGDFCQHAPQGGHSLYYGADPAHVHQKSWRAAEKLGRSAFLQFDTCVILQQQFRFDTSIEDGRKIHSMVQMLSAETQPTWDECAWLCDNLNERAITPVTFQRMCQTEVPRAVVLRNCIRPALNARLATLQAGLAGQRLIVWRCVDVGTSSRPLSTDLLAVIEQLPSNKTGDMPTIQMYFTGIKYKFSSSDYPSVGCCNNNIAEGVALHLDPREPPDDFSTPYRTLRFLPIAVIVRPEGHAAVNLRLSSWPKGCVPIERVKKAARYVLKLPKAVKLYRGDDTEGNVVTVNRIGFRLEVANAVTDVFAQGMSFRGAPYVLHLNIPPDGKLHRANLLVPISRPSLFSQLHLLAPLYSVGDKATRSSVIQKVYNTLKPDPHLVAEMQRLRALAGATLTRWQIERYVC